MTRRLAALLAVLGLVVGGVPTALAAPPTQYPAGSSGIGDPYFPLDGNGGEHVSHYDLALTYDPATDTLTGVATIQARTTQDLGQFDLDFVGLHLRSLTVNGVATTFQRKDQELIVKPRTGLAKGSNLAIVARYDGVPAALDE